MMGGAKNIDFLAILNYTTKARKGKDHEKFVILSHSTFTKVLDKLHKESRNYIWFKFI
jgi:hypothetical protein